VVVGEALAGRGVRVADARQQPAGLFVSAGLHDAAGVRFRGEPVEGVPGFVHVRSVGIGFARFQPRGVVIAPGGDVSIRAAGGVFRDVSFLRRAEGGQAHQAVGFVIAQEQGLRPRPPFGRFPASGVVSGAHRISQRVRHHGGQVKAGVVLRDGLISGGVRHADGSSGQVGPDRRCVAPAVRAGQGHARSRIGAGGRFRDARVVLLREHQAVRRHRLSRDAGRGDNALLDSFRIFSILRPFRRSQAAFVNDDRFCFQNPGEFGDEFLPGAGQRFSLCIITYLRRDQIDAVLRVFHAEGIFPDGAVVRCGLLRQGERFPGHVAEGVVFVERGRHGGGPLLRSRIPPCADEAPLFIVFGTVIQEPGSRGRHLHDALSEAVDQGPGEEGRLVGEGNGFPQTVIADVIDMVAFALSRAVFMEYGAVGVTFRDEGGAGGRRDGFRQAVFAVGCRRHAAQHIGLPDDTAEPVVFHAFRRGHGSPVPARLQDAPGGVPGVGGDGFRGYDRVSVADFRTDGFHQLVGAVVAVRRQDPVFVRFRELAAAHPGRGADAAVAPRGFRAAAFFVVFMGAA